MSPSWPDGLCQNYSTQPLSTKVSHRQYITLFIKPGHLNSVLRLQFANSCYKIKPHEFNFHNHKIHFKLTRFVLNNNSKKQGKFKSTGEDQECLIWKKDGIHENETEMMRKIRNNFVSGNNSHNVIENKNKTHLHLTLLSTVMLQIRGQRWQTNRKSSWHQICLSSPFLHRTRSWPWAAQGWWSGCRAQKRVSSDSPWEYSPCLLAGGSSCRRVKGASLQLHHPSREEIFGERKRDTTLNQSPPDTAVWPPSPCNSPSLWASGCLNWRHFCPDEDTVRKWNEKQFLMLSIDTTPKKTIMEKTVSKKEYKFTVNDKDRLLTTTKKLCLESGACLWVNKPRQLPCCAR